MIILGHRGSAGTALENTWEAIEAGWQSGADGVEVDVHLSADEEIVIHHDKTTKRLSSTRAKIKNTPWETLSEIDLIDKNQLKHRIPLLKDYFHRAPRDKALFLEIKSNASMVPVLAKIIPDWMMAHLCIISFRPEVITAVKDILPDLPCLLLLEKRIIRDYSSNIIAQAKQLGADGLGLDHTGVTASLAKAIKEAGLYLSVWTVNNMDDIDRFHAMGVDALTTDYPKAFAELRKSLL